MKRHITLSISDEAYAAFQRHLVGQLSAWVEAKLLEIDRELAKRDGGETENQSVHFYRCRSCGNIRRIDNPTPGDRKRVYCDNCFAALSGNQSSIIRDENHAH